MALQKVIVIWLDGTFERGKYQSMKNEFNENIVSSTSSDSIDSLICDETKQDLVTNGASVITVQTPNEAMQQIENNPGAKFFLISSGSLGRDMVPTVVRKYPLIHSFYIYCFKMTEHIDWALEYADCLKMFDHHVDLLVRLMRDISAYLIKQGEAYLEFNDPTNALKYFKDAWNLETRANERDKMQPNTKNTGKPLIQPDYRDHLDLLEGENGLIRRAEKALKK